jgi:hypothetical protein
MAPPIQFGLGLSLARAGGAALDADAAVYIAAVETAGATVSGGQKKAIDTFYKTGKSDGWYSSIKRMYLPIWAAAAPNAIDMMELGSGTFNGTVTHGAGFVQGDGTTGYFAFSSTPSDDSLLATSNFQFMLIKTAETAIGITAQGTSNSFRFRRTTVNSRINTLTGGSDICSANILRIDQVGIFAGSRIAADNHAQYQRITSGFNTLATDLVTNTTAAVPAVAYTAMAMNGAFNFFDAEQGAYGYGLGLSSAETAAFTLALKDLWETATGLTLP